jgi:hypothetical protein
MSHQPKKNIVFIELDLKQVYWEERKHLLAMVLTENLSQILIKKSKI